MDPVPSNPSYITWTNQFWGEENRGYQALCQKLESGQLALRQLSEWLSTRVRSEQAYADSLAALGKNLPTGLEEGSFKEFIEKMGNFTEMSSHIHSQVGTKIQEELTVSVTRLEEKIQALRQKYDISMERLAKNVTRDMTELETRKLDYFDKCKILAKSVETASRGRTDTMTKKDYEKIQAKVIKSKHDTDAAEIEYKCAIDRANLAQNEWEAAVADAAPHFQAIESERLELTKHILGKMVFMEENLVVQMKQEGLKKVRTSLDALNVNDTLNIYLDKFKTGSERVTRIEFVKPDKNEDPANTTSGEPSTKVPSKRNSASSSIATPNIDVDRLYRSLRSSGTVRSASNSPKSPRVDVVFALDSGHVPSPTQLSPLKTSDTSARGSTHDLECIPKLKSPVPPKRTSVFSVRASFADASPNGGPVARPRRGTQDTFNFSPMVKALIDLKRESFPRKTIKMQGYLDLVQDLETIEKVWCIIEGGYLQAYESEEDAECDNQWEKPEPEQMWNLTKCEISINEENKSQFTVDGTTFKIENQEERACWIEILTTYCEKTN